MNQFPHSVRDEYAMECPQCKSDQEIRIWATQAIKVTLVSDGTRDDGDGGDTEWEDNSRAECGECGYDGEVRHFRIVTEEVKERKLEDQWRYEVQCCYTKLGFEAWKAEEDGGNPVQTPESGANSDLVSLKSDSEGRLWVISGPGSMWWNNDEGWVPARSDATRFPDPEKNMFSLPMEGNWVSLEEIAKNKSDCQASGLPTLSEAIDAVNGATESAREKLKEHLSWDELAQAKELAMPYLRSLYHDYRRRQGEQAATLPWRMFGQPGVGKSSVIEMGSDSKEAEIAALLNNILWHLEHCASEPDGGGAAYMAKELRKLIEGQP